MEQAKQSNNSWFDRELAAIVAVFAGFWLLVIGGGYYANSAIACLSFSVEDNRPICAKALELSVLPPPLKSKVRVKLIESYTNFSENEKALALLDDEIKNGGGTVWAYEKQAALLTNLDRLDEAQVAHRNVLKLDKANENAASLLVGLAMRDSKFAEARKTAADYVKDNPQSAYMMSWQGWIEHRAGDNELAMRYFDQVIALSPNTDGYYRDIADIKLAMEKPAEAIDAMTSAIKIAPEETTFLEKRASIYESMGETKLAQADYEASLAVGRGAESLILLGRSYTDSGDFEKAMLLIDEALAQQVEVAWAYESKIRLLVRQKKLEDAKIVIGQLTAFDATSVDARFWTAVITHSNGRLDEALNDFQNLVKDAPNYVNADIEIGHVLIDLNRAAESVVHFTASIADRPKAADAYAGRARANHSLQNWWAAISDSNQSLKLQPRQSEVSAYRGLSYEKIGKLENAKASLKTASLNGPDLEWIQRENLRFLIENNYLDDAKNALQGVRDTSPTSGLVMEFAAKLRGLGVDLP